MVKQRSYLALAGCKLSFVGYLHFCNGRLLGVLCNTLAELVTFKIVSHGLENLIVSDLAFVTWLLIKFTENQEVNMNL